MSRLNEPVIMSQQVGIPVTTLSFCPIFRTNLGVVLAYAACSIAADISAARVASGLAEGDMAPGCIVIGAYTGTQGSTSDVIWCNTAANNSCTWTAMV